ncbi:MAG: RadC family protein [Bacteroidia bacterium]
MKNNTKLSIKNWAEDDRPREKLLQKGRHALSDAELIAILIGSGSKNLSAVELAQKILHHSGNDLNKLGKLSIKDLMQHKGIGEAKAITIAAALELGRRRKESENSNTKIIKSSKDAYNFIAPFLKDLSHEEFWAIYLSRNNSILYFNKIGQGGLSATVADIRIILKTAIEHLASNIIICHNHPSGNKNPSKADIELTQKLKQAAGLMDINLIDHIIFTDNSYYSFAEESII